MKIKLEIEADKWEEHEEISLYLYAPELMHGMRNISNSIRSRLKLDISEDEVRFLDTLEEIIADLPINIWS